MLPVPTRALLVPLEEGGRLSEKSFRRTPVLGAGAGVLKNAPGTGRAGVKGSIEEEAVNEDGSRPGCD